MIVCPLTNDIIHCQVCKGDKQSVPYKLMLKTSQGKAIKAILLVATVDTSRENGGKMVENNIVILSLSRPEAMVDHSGCVKAPLLAAEVKASREKG